MRAVRRSVSLMSLPLLGALASCGIPTTGVVEAGGPASGVVPTIRVYFVADGALLGAPRSTPGPVDVESAVRVLLEGPTERERRTGLSTLLPPARSAASPVPPTGAPTWDGRAESRSSDPVEVTSRNGHVTIRLTAVPAHSTGLAASQLICTALAVQRVAAPGAEPLPVTVTGPGGLAVRGTVTRCPP